MRDIDLLRLDIDTRLSEVWAEIASLPWDKLDLDVIGDALRASYYQGYKDGRADQDQLMFEFEGLDI